MTSPTKRRDMDIMKLMMSQHEVQMGKDEARDFYVKFHGPKTSPYENGIWKVHVTLPATYPYKSPSIGFCNTIYHPNIDEASGSVCLDVINQTWSPMFDLVNIFQVFLPQLLLYPNPSDPLNGEAAALLMQNKPAYEEKVKEYVGRYASHDIKVAVEEDDDDDDDDDDDNEDDANMAPAADEPEEQFSDVDEEPAEAADLEL